MLSATFLILAAITLYLSTFKAFTINDVYPYALCLVGCGVVTALWSIEDTLKNRE